MLPDTPQRPRQCPNEKSTAPRLPSPAVHTRAGVVVCVVGVGAERLQCCTGTWHLDGGRPGCALAAERRLGRLGKS